MQVLTLVSLLTWSSTPEHLVLRRLYAAGERLHPAEFAVPWPSWQQRHTAVCIWNTEAACKQHSETQSRWKINYSCTVSTNQCNSSFTQICATSNLHITDCILLMSQSYTLHNCTLQEISFFLFHISFDDSKHIFTLI